ncbi:MAG: glycoside hydrolase family 57 protein [Bacteroidales bacterium]|nr:glycoside hydrolase family 57 protein [Bacteroidales bacterium]
MRTICLYFQVHQPFRFRRYRFFDIGNDHYYYDDYLNESILRKVADKSYLPTNKLMLELIKKYKGKFKFSLSISGIAVEQFKLYAPEVLESFRELADTGCVEFLSETYAHSLASMKNEEEFLRQIELHRDLIRKEFGQEPVIFRNTELIYSDEIGQTVSRLGYKGMLTEGAKHVLGWKSPNYLYCNALNPKLKLLLKNFKLSDDIAFRFSNKGWVEYPLTAEKFVSWLNQIPANEDTVNLFMDYETFGEHQWKETGIFEFLKAFPEQVFKHSKFTFNTPSELVSRLQVIAAANVPYPISWADEERDLTAWLGNEMQHEAFNKLYSLQDKVYQSDEKSLIQDFMYLQVSDHFYYMSTKFFSDGAVHSYFNPYNTPYEAFINFMNILSDFEIRVNAAVSVRVDDDLVRLSKIIQEKDKEIQKYQERLERMKAPSKTDLRKVISKETEILSPVTEKDAAKKSPAKKSPAKKASSSKKESEDKPSSLKKTSAESRKKTKTTTRKK